ncbi:hypothetical protein [Burkholderia pseudomultivorans]|uniref:YqaJ viral recombinase domain-containing protein n=1 Tax=Burkholderia pseudomultivorans TaxID=1207504 RepID=A0ABU2E0R3_9BURK|nr:hypothetical protein [Burkholderia pseudomultivorans]MDR8727417.1 hypothetical protein [Burkholderia pseudomultivorans]MDR8732491.1 hypothetical protein [Burkholderia pseudomultivorans]MDR8739357.1 hypothetical protein [Burkholderia pseudomultivorans]MDR8753447.1 hypothetical protein [Burkholderia pseudomultivorans]MDR8775415.1 hypothetical protein [Burkholderia pseudomultivorans]
MIDLYAVHEEKALDGLLTIHPSRWLYAGRHLGHSAVFDLRSREDQVVRVGNQVIRHFRQLRDAGLDSKTRHKRGYYYATPAVAKRYFEYVPQGRMLECAVRDMLSLSNPDGYAEVHTPAGFVDLLLPSAVVEVKSFIRWKHALGQVLAYSTYYPHHARVIHLYVHGDRKPRLDPQLRVCSQFDVQIKYQNLLPGDLGPMSRLGKIVAA